MRKINYTWEMLQDDCKVLVDDLKRNQIKITNIYGIPRGGLVAGVILSHLLKKPLILNEKEISDTTLVVDDISDSGETLKKLQKRVFEKPSVVRLIVVTLWCDEETKYFPMFHCRVKKKKEWVIMPFETLISSKRDGTMGK